ncbi:hypothetical protein BKA65DRAFT_572007 [Rhexocercosporidium sp. MPI-PUGE-AT-0058]|nr:hypothetical protein BKA65DRAFT_572007 [Rhexocercosporidium sp. MPI-PUGE-AT-0058]
MSHHQRIAQLEEEIRQLQSAQNMSTYSFSHPSGSEEPNPQFSGHGLDPARQYTPLQPHPESPQHQRPFPYGGRVIRAGNHTTRRDGQPDDRIDAMWELQSTECVQELVRRVERLEYWWMSNMEKQHAESRLHSVPEPQRSNLSLPNSRHPQAQIHADGVRPTSNSGMHLNNMSFTSPAPSLRNPREVHPELPATQLPQPASQSYETQMTAPYILNQPHSSGFIGHDHHPSNPQDLVPLITAGHIQPAPEQQQQYSQPLTDGFRETDEFEFWSKLA